MSKASHMRVYIHIRYRNVGVLYAREKFAKSAVRGPHGPSFIICNSSALKDTNGMWKAVLQQQTT